jgi:putative aminophosphonate oxidoreductase
MRSDELARPHRSLWLESSLGSELDAPPLSGRSSVDVAIVGGGYVGLWTALRIKELEPDCRVAVLERDICGGGASGRNGGFVLSWWPKFPSLVKAFGADEALRLVRASEDAIDTIGSFCRLHGIDAHFTQAGWLWTATSAAQENSWETVVARAEALSPGTFARLDPREVATRSGSPKHRAGVLECGAATVQPAALVRGMRRVAIDKGVEIFEHTTLRRFSRAHPMIAETSAGTIAANSIVLATNAWAIGVPELSRSIAVISSDIVATAPMPDRLAEIGWTGGECITDSQMMVCYYRTTRDGRIAFGKGGWGLVYGDRIGAEFDRDPERAALVTRDLRRYYPMLADVPVTHDWCGPIDRSMDGLPVIGTLGSSGAVHFGIGWSGNGVGPSLVGGKILASLALGRKDEWSSSGLVNRRTATFPPEPIRYLGAHVVRKAVLAKEEAEMAGRSPSSIAVHLARLAPAGLEDKG